MFDYFLAAAKSEPLRLLPPEPENTTDVEDCIRKAKMNEPDFTRININNIKEINANVLKDLLNSLKTNTHVEILEMANVGMTDSIGRVSHFELCQFCLETTVFHKHPNSGISRTFGSKFNIENNQCRIESFDRPCYK
jgi:hypothetical protein